MSDAATASEVDPLAIRKALGWSQERMAEELGCDQATVSRIENGGSISGPIQRLLRVLKRHGGAR